MKRRSVVAVWLCVLVCAFASPAAAHRGSSKYLFVERTAAGLDVRAEIELIDAAAEIGLDPDHPETARAAPHLIAISRWIARSIRVHAGLSACSPAASPPRSITRDSRPYLSIALTFRCANPSGRLVLEDRAVFANDPQHESYVHLTTAHAVSTVILRHGRQSLEIDAPPGLGSQAQSFFLLGMHHLLVGYDHLLFLFSLLFAAAALAARESTRAGLKHAALVVTGFTLGHSITLILAGLNIVTPPSRWVESSIALSIVLVALWNLSGAKNLRARAPVTAAFGLIHGFGFSSVLRDLLLPTDSRIVTLVSFNVGIEVAQLLIVGAVILPLAWAAKQAWYDKAVMRAGSLAIALVAAYWFVDRAFLA